MTPPVHPDKVDRAVAGELLTVRRSPLFLQVLPWLLCVVLAILALRSCGRTSPPPQYELTKETRATLDRFAAHLRADSVQRRADSIETARLVGVAVAAAADAQRARSAARLLGARADSLAALGEFPDAYRARTSERDSLLRVVDAQVQQIVATSARASLDSTRAARADSLLNEATVRVIPQLRAEVDSAYQRGLHAHDCTVGPSFAQLDCPTRTEAALGGTLLGALLALVVAAAMR